jgi:hypothetical protein
VTRIELKAKSVYGRQRLDEACARNRSEIGVRYGSDRLPLQICSDAGWVGQLPQSGLGIGACAREGNRPIEGAGIRSSERRNNLDAPDRFPAAIA